MREVISGERLLWGHGRTEADQLRRAEILMMVPDKPFQRLLAIDDEAAREREVEALERAYAERWESMNDQRTHHYQSPLYGGRIDRFHAHLADHWGCPGIHKCREFTPNAGEGPVCPFCDELLTSARDLKWGSHYRCWKASH